MNQDTPEPILVSVTEAARVLSLAPWGVYELCLDGTIATRGYDGYCLVEYASLQAFASSLPAGV